MYAYVPRYASFLQVTLSFHQKVHFQSQIKLRFCLKIRRLRLQSKIRLCVPSSYAFIPSKGTLSIPHQAKLTRYAATPTFQDMVTFLKITLSFYQKVHFNPKSSYASVSRYSVTLTFQDMLTILHAFKYSLSRSFHQSIKEPFRIPQDSLPFPRDAFKIFQEAQGQVHLFSRKYCFKKIIY